MPLNGHFADFHDRALKDEVTLPSLPDIALRVHRVAGDPDCTFTDIGKVLKADAALSAQLVRLANSPVYRGRVPATNVRSAVHRLGVTATRNFVTSFALNNLFQSPDSELNQQFRRLWEDSCQISALTVVLATYCAGFDPDDALLAGLLQDIGAVALLGALAERDGPLPAAQDIAAGLDEWTPRIGALLLKQWGFDERYLDVVRSRHDWTRNSAGEADLADLVTLARLHRYVETGRAGACPAIDSTPAYTKIPAGKVAESGGLAALEEADDQVSAVREILRG